MRERQQRGISAFAPTRGPIEWTAEMIALLGTDSDKVIGEMLSVSYNTVRQKRLELDIAPYNKPNRRYKSFKWTKAQLALLGTMSDAALAKRLNLSPTTVVRKRKQLGVASFQPPPKWINWTEQMIKDLAQMGDKEVAHKYSISVEAVEYKRRQQNLLRGRQMHIWTEGQLKLLGRMPDNQLAKQLSLPVHIVTTKRASLAIAPFRQHNPHRDWTPEEIALLGTMPDRLLAEKLGLTRELVKSRRSYYGVPPFKVYQNRKTQ